MVNVFVFRVPSSTYKLDNPIATREHCVKLEFPAQKIDVVSRWIEETTREYSANRIQTNSTNSNYADVLEHGLGLVPVGLGREDLGRILVAFELLVSDAAILAVTLCSAHRSQEFHALVLPRLDESISELVHHCLVVLGSRSDTQAFFSTFHCGIVD
ncbi:hypothetical protein P5673_003872 [Acropora cervicornis]|uniref:Uncharacterized protein n=1 Tax=Acropora cervicornis TaxID=6130 RepID=A0AAD9VER7_ACRCE|nr:hypothetical protein P5673_003872 [Acropora cervicornis]